MPEISELQFKQVKPTSHWLQRTVFTSIPTPPGNSQRWYKKVTRGTAVGAAVTGASMIDLAISLVGKREESSWLRKWIFPSISLLAGTSLISGSQQRDNTFGANLVSFGILSFVDKIREKINALSTESTFNKLFTGQYISKVKNTIGSLLNGIFSTINGDLQSQLTSEEVEGSEDRKELLNLVKDISTENYSYNDLMKFIKENRGALIQYCEQNPNNILGRLFSSDRGTVRGNIRELTEHINELLEPIGLSLGLKYAEESNLFEIYIHTNEPVSDTTWKNSYKPCIAISARPEIFCGAVNNLLQSLSTTIKNHRKGNLTVQEIDKSVISALVDTIDILSRHSRKLEGGYSEIDKITGGESSTVQLLGPLQHLTDEPVIPQLNKLLEEILEGKRVVPASSIFGGMKTNANTTSHEPNVQSATTKDSLTTPQSKEVKTLDDVLNTLGFTMTDNDDEIVQKLKFALIKSFVRHKFDESEMIGNQQERISRRQEVTAFKNAVNEALENDYNHDYKSYYTDVKVTSDKITPPTILELNNFLPVLGLETKEDLMVPQNRKRFLNLVELLPDENQLVLKNELDSVNEEPHLS